MTLFILGLLLFLGIHSISIISEPWRDRLAGALGVWTWKGVYSIVAVIGFILLVWGYSAARPQAVELYSPPVWLQHLSLVLLLPVFPLLLAAYLPGRIKTITRHPMLLATKLWAVAHLLANGSSIDVILFSSFLAWAVLDRLSVNRRLPRSVPSAPAFAGNDLIALLAGLGIYLAFLFRLHETLIGVPPL